MVWTTRRRRLFSELQPSFGRRQPPSDSRISLTGNIHRLGKGLEHVLGLFGRGHPLVRKAIQPAPYQIGASAEINHTPRQALVHGNVGLSGEWVSRIESGP